MDNMDNYFSWLERQNKSEGVVEDSAEFKEEEHPRESKGSGKGGQFAKKPETLAKEDNIDNLSVDDFEDCSPERFHRTISRAKNNTPEDIRWRVDVKSIDAYSHCHALMRTKGGSCVAVRPTGDIISVCRPNTDVHTHGRDLLRKARHRDGDRLDSFDGNWYFYVHNGFEPISWTPFNETYAPKGWKKGRDKPENIVFFAYTGRTSKNNTIDKTDWFSSHKPFEGENGYDEAMKARDDFINRKKEKGNE